MQYLGNTVEHITSTISLHISRLSTFLTNVWHVLGENKDAIQAIGSILSPVAIFTGGVIIQVWLNRQSKERFEREQQATNDRAEKQQELTELIAERDKENAIERLRIETLANYLDRITELTKDPSSVVDRFSLIKAITISTLKELDSSRNKQVTNLLHETSFSIRSSNPFGIENGILFSADLEGANLKGAVLKNADLRFANLQGSNLEGANLQGANLEGANLSGADLRSTNLSNAVLNQAQMQSANLSNANLSSASLRSVNACSAGFSNATIHEADFKEASLKWADFFQAEIEDSTFSDANLRGAKFINATVKGSDFVNAFFKYAKFSLSHLTDVNFQNAYLRLIEFESSVAISGERGTINARQGMSIPLTSGDKIVTGKAKLTKVDFRDARLDSANFEGAVFEDVDLRGYQYRKDYDAAPTFPTGFSPPSDE